MCIIAFGVGSFTSLIRRYVILWLGGILLGGIMTFLMSSGTMDVYSDALKSDTSPFAVIPAGILLLFISVRAVSSAPKVRFATVAITFRKVKLDLRSMCDTGNLLEDPITGRPVIVICEKAARRLFFSAEYEYLTGEATEIPNSLEGRTYVIPARSVSGDVLLRAVRPDSITVNGNERRALIAVSEKLSGEAFEAVLSPKLL
jgi:sigma-E processing peptidase SpoIIGA